MAPLREAYARRRGRGPRRPLRLRTLLLPQCTDATGQWFWPLLLFAEDGEPPRGEALERCLRAGPGRARHTARDHKGYGPDRDDTRDVRDARDPLRASRALRRPQLRPVGLHLLLHQEVPRTRYAPPRPQLRDDDGPVHARLLAAHHQDLPPARS